MQEYSRRNWMKATTLGVGAMSLGCSGANLLAESDSRTLMEEFKHDWKLKKGHTYEIAEAMPADKYDFKPTPEMRTFGGMWGAIGMPVVYLVNELRGINPPMSKGPQTPKETTKEAILPYIEAFFDYSLAALDDIASLNLDEVVTMAEGNYYGSRRNILLLMRDHNTHHMGYAIPYLRLSGITKIPRFRFMPSAPK